MQEFEHCPFGIIGLETAIALALEELVHPGKITLSRMVELFTTGPESVMRLGRGTLAPSPGRRDDLQHRSRMDLRRESIAFAQPQFAVRRANVSRRAGGDGGERRGRLAPVRVSRDEDPNFGGDRGDIAHVLGTLFRCR